MRTTKDQQLVPVRVLQVGSMEALLWQPLQEARGVHLGGDGQVSLHRAGQTPVGRREGLTLLTPEQLSQAIDALQQAREFLSNAGDEACAAAQMFVCAMEMLEARAR